MLAGRDDQVLGDLHLAGRKKAQVGFAIELCIDAAGLSFRKRKLGERRLQKVVLLLGIEPDRRRRGRGQIAERGLRSFGLGRCARPNAARTILGARVLEQLVKTQPLRVIPNFNDFFFSNPSLAGTRDSWNEAELGLTDPESRHAEDRAFDATLLGAGFHCE